VAVELTFGDRAVIVRRHYCRQEYDFMKRYFFVLIALSMAVCGCFRPSDRSITISVPQMNTADCAARIVAAFKLDRPDRVDGVISVVPNLENHTVEVTFKSLVLSIKNVQMTIANAGFDADEVKANEEARKALPEECRGVQVEHER
jgi:mercuric ion binding protein